MGFLLSTFQKYSNTGHYVNIGGILIIIYSSVPSKHIAELIVPRRFVLKLHLVCISISF